MSMTAEKVIRILRKAAEKDLLNVMSEGYGWYKYSFIPALNYVRCNVKEENELITKSYYFLAGMFYLIGAWKAAIRSNKKALRCNPNFAEAYVDIGSLYYEMGKYKKAIGTIEKGLSMNPDIYWGEDYLEDAKEAIEKNEQSDYDENGVETQVYEYLAQDKPQKALKLVNRKRLSKYRLLKYMALGILYYSNKVYYKRLIFK